MNKDKPATVYYIPATRFLGIQLDFASKLMEEKYGLTCLEKQNVDIINIQTFIKIYLMKSMMMLKVF